MCFIRVNKEQNESPTESYFCRNGFYGTEIMSASRELDNKTSRAPLLRGASV